MLERIYLNDNWNFYRLDDKKSATLVRLPHTNTELPFNYLDENDYQFVSVYENEYFAPSDGKDKLYFLTFEGAAHRATVYVNDIEVITHNNGYTAFKVEISKYLKYGKSNKIKVELDSRESLNIPPFGHVIDYLTYGGLYREVYIDITEKAYIDDVFVRTVSCDRDLKTVAFDLKLDTTDEISLKDATVEIAIYDGKKLIARSDRKHALREMSIRLSSYDFKLWDIDKPQMYRALASLRCGDMVDEIEVRFGVRDAQFKADGFYLNGKRVKIRGLNRHQSYPYVGYAMPESMQANDAFVLKNKLSVNAVRTSHYPQSKYFLDACDNLGILVFTESPGWQHIGDKAWKEQHLKNVEEMVLQYRNHPSVILWGVRINESQDDEELYLRANEIAHKLDNTRPTSGVRYLQMSQMLEDVYAFNDFSHTGNNNGLQPKMIVTPKAWKPYLVSEYNGHMFPTKMYDDEAHRLSHALRHANVLNSMYDSSNGISGCFGWCMADYNTHKDFGSGDKICYHGVLDMFRNPKLAAAVYSSQGDGDPVLEVSSSMDIGEHPAGSLGDVYVFTNADCVNLYKNDKFIARFEPDREHYPNMPHPPILINDLIGCQLERDEGLSAKSADGIKRAVHGYMTDSYKGVLTPKNIYGLGSAMLRDRITIKHGIDIALKYVMGWGSDVTIYRFDAIKNNRVVKSVTCAPASSISLSIVPSSTVLHENTTYDVAEINISAISEYGNIVPYYDEPIILKTEGPIELIGPSAIPLRGGVAGTYVKTIGKTGKAKLIVSSERTGHQIINFTIK